MSLRFAREDLPSAAPARLRGPKAGGSPPP